MTKPNYFEIKKKTDKLYKTYWLRFTKKIPQKGGLFVAIAFRLIPKKTKCETKKVVYKIDEEVQKGDVSIFFPADKETSNLRFYLHAPFAATVARDSIKTQSENIELRDLLVELLIESLLNIKKFGLLDCNFLALLPNDKDEIPEFYEPFRDKIIEAFQNGSYTPTWNSSFSPAKNLLQSASEIKKIINRKNILNHLVEKENVNWVIDADKGSRLHNFLTSLKIEEWTWQELLEKVGELFSDKDIAKEILITFPDEWLKSFYVLLGKAKEKTSIYYWHRYKIADANIVRLQDGTHIAGKNIYFQTELIKNIENLPVVKPEIYQSSKNKNQNEKAERFLRDVGVKEFEERDEIKIILDKHYKDNSIVNGTEHIKHLRKFVTFLRKNSAEKSVFSTYDFLIAEDAEEDAEIYYCKPSEVFIDEPYEKTNLSAIENFLIRNSKWKLWSGYLNKIKKQNEFIQFLKDIGANFKLKIKLCDITNNPDILSLKQDLAKGTREMRDTSINRDYYIENLDEMLSQKNRSISQLIWQTMSDADKTILQARYRPNQQYKERTAPSYLIHNLIQYAWIPDKEGNFHRPEDITRDMLPDDFPANNSNGWLSAIGLGTQAEKSKLNEQQKLERLAKQLNLTVEQLEKAKEYAKMTAEEKADFEEFKQLKIKKETEETENQPNPDIEEETNTEEETSDSTSSENEDGKNQQEEEEEKRIRKRQTSVYKVTQLVEARYGQGIFRANVEKTENKCRLTDVNDKRVLIASHIKPWRKSTDDEKLDGNNGLLLSPHVDKLFDKGWITFTDDGKILCADDRIKEIMKVWGLEINKFIGSFNEQQKKYLAYHRENIYKSE